jgi:hypothetical protein
MKKLATVLLPRFRCSRRVCRGGERRVVFRISTAEADALKAEMVSIDQGAQTFPASSVTLRDRTVKIAIPGLGGGFDGKLSADGKTIACTWTQGRTPVALTLELATPQTAWAIQKAAEKPNAMAENGRSVV